MKSYLPPEPRRYPEQTEHQRRRDTLLALSSPKEAEKIRKKRRFEAWMSDPDWAVAVVCSRKLHRYTDPYHACTQVLGCAPPASILHAVEAARDRYHRRQDLRSPYLSKNDRNLAFDHMIFAREPGQMLQRYLTGMLNILVGIAGFRGDVISGVFYRPNPALVCCRVGGRYTGPSYTVQTTRSCFECRPRRGRARVC